MPVETFQTSRFQYVCIVVPGMDDARVMRYRRGRHGRLKWVIDEGWVTRYYPTFEAAR